MQGAGSGKVGAQELHLISQDISALQVDILGMGWSKRNCQQLHSSLLRCLSRLVVVAAHAGGDYIVPVVGAALTYRAHMIPRELPAWKHEAAIETDMVVPLEECVVV